MEHNVWVLGPGPRKIDTIKTIRDCNKSLCLKDANDLVSGNRGYPALVLEHTSEYATAMLYVRLVTLQVPVTADHTTCLYAARMGEELKNGLKMAVRDLRSDWLNPMLSMGFIHNCLTFDMALENLEKVVDEMQVHYTD